VADLTNWIRTFLSLNPELEANLLNSLLIILVLTALRLLAIFLVNQRTEDVRLRYRWRKTTTYVAAVLGVLLLGRVWLAGRVIESVATLVGLVSAGLAIALRDPIADLFGWGFIMWRRPFDVGDRIQIGEHAGDVIDVRIFQFTILEIGNWVAADQSTGRIIHVPNGKIFTDALANYSRGLEYIWNEMPVLVTFESNWEKAKTVLQEIANRHAAHLSQAAERRVRRAARQYMIMYSKLTPIVYTRVEASGVLLTIRYLCEPRKRRSSENAIWEDVLRVFAQNPDIDFAYPTQRFYDRLREAAAGADDHRQTPEAASVGEHSER
jgi:small-conductance mechanosensitive channel